MLCKWLNRKLSVPLRPILKTNDKNMNKISYALGLGIGQQLKSMGIEDFNVQDFTQSICDVLTDAEPAISHREAQALLNEYFDKQARKQAEGAIAEGKAFMEAHGKKDGCHHKEWFAVYGAHRGYGSQPQGYGQGALSL